MSDDSNPYLSPAGLPSQLCSVTVYIDILGYSDLIRKIHAEGTGQDFLIKFRQVLDESYSQLKPDENIPDAFNIKIPGMKYIYMVRTFSDNIVIGYPIGGHSEFALGHIFSLLGMFQLNMVLSGFFIRGAISIGDLYLDNDIIFGKGLLDAYDAERKIARDPRIILTTSASDYVKEHLTYYADPRNTPHNRNLFRDADGQLFLNYLECILIAEYEQGPYLEELLQHKVIVEQKLKEYITQPQIWNKYLWVANYHNYFCSQYSKYFDNSFKIDLRGFQMVPTRLI